jgi:dTDP-4-dehydrorhamnose reductase
VKWLAETVSRLPGSRLIHISTDFVFDGAGSVPYAPDAPTAPMSVYGSTKLAGEKFVAGILGARGLVLRTSWVYDASGRNFLNTMLRLMREEKPLRVVVDQVGTPTWAGSIAEVLWRFAGRADLSGIWHWSDAGVASWYDFAVAIAEEAHAGGLLARLPQVTPVSTAEYSTPAKRPSFSVLDKRATIDAIGIPVVHWRQNLRRVIKEKSLG